MARVRWGLGTVLAQEAGTGLEHAQSCWVQILSSRLPSGGGPGVGWACSGGPLCPSPADPTLHGALAPAQALVLLLVLAVALALGQDLHCHGVREAQRPDVKGLSTDALCGRDLHLEGDLWKQGQGSGGVSG